MSSVTEFVLSVIINSVIVYLIFKVMSMKTGPENPESPSKQEKQDYKYALGVAVAASVLALVIAAVIPPVYFYLASPLGFLLDIILIKVFYSENWKKSIIAGTAWWILGYVVGLLGIV